MKYLRFFIFIIFIYFISCKSQEVIEPEIIIEEEHGFRYEVPSHMTESPEEAARYRYDNLLVERGKRFDESEVIIAIRKNENYQSLSLDKFAENDLSLLNTQVKINYIKEEWEPSGFKEKEIDFIACQFSYNYGKLKLFQRSVYLTDKSDIYIISMTTKDIYSLLDNDNDYFWQNVRID